MKYEVFTNKKITRICVFLEFMISHMKQWLRPSQISLY